MRSSTLLLIDAAVNLALGVLLLLFPRGLVDLLGLPASTSKFYPSILGAVLFGIGIALFLERYKSKTSIVGLGLAGAIAINLSGGAVLTLWLVFGELQMSQTGFVVLGILTLVLVAISAIELRAQLRQPQPLSSQPIGPRAARSYRARDTLS